MIPRYADVQIFLIICPCVGYALSQMINGKNAGKSIKLFKISVLVMFFFSDTSRGPEGDVTRACTTSTQTHYHTYIITSGNTDPRYCEKLIHEMKGEFLGLGPDFLRDIHVDTNISLNNTEVTPPVRAVM